MTSIAKPLASSKGNVVPLRLVSNVNANTVEILETLLELARMGEITGLAFGCVLKGNQFFVNASGHCIAHPTFARAMIGVLNDRLATIIQRRDPMGLR